MHGQNHIKLIFKFFFFLNKDYFYSHEQQFGNRIGSCFWVGIVVLLGRIHVAVVGRSFDDVIRRKERTG